MQIVDYFVRNSSLQKSIDQEADHSHQIYLMDRMRKTRLTISLSFIFSTILFLTTIALLFSVYPQLHISLFILIVISFYFATIPFIYKLVDSDLVIKLLLLGGGTFAIFIRALATSGARSSAFYWLCLVPLSSTLIFERKTIPWALVISIIIATIILMGKNLGIFFGPPHSELSNYFGLIGLLLTSTMTAVAFDRQSSFFQNQMLKQEKEIQDTKKLASLGTMAAGVAHEVNNPLMIISGNLVILERVIDQLDVDQEDHFKMMNHLEKTSNNISRIKNIIQSLLSYSRMKSKDNFKTFTIESFINNLKEIINESQKVNTVQWPNMLDPQLNLTGDFTLLTQVFTNLIYNAYHATKDLPHNQIVIRFERKFNQIYLSVTDQGVIDDSEIIENMFHPFYTTKPIGEGTGLGLSLSKGIIEMHGGELYYDPLSNTTSFIVTLPLKS